MSRTIVAACRSKRRGITDFGRIGEIKELAADGQYAQVGALRLCQAKPATQ